MNEHLEHLIIDMKGSLEREIGELSREVRSGFAEVKIRFDTQATRLDRQAGLMQSGGRRIVRLDEWADQALEAKDQEIADLRERLSKIERQQPPL